MIDKEQIQTLVESVKYPETNKYYENDSADGFAFLGAAKALLGLDPQQEILEIIHRNYSLNSPLKIRKIKMTAHNLYVYTFWTCMELFRQFPEHDRTRAFIMSQVERIGTYENGMMRYCLEEAHYLVPNVTSAAALMKVIVEKYDDAIDLLFLMRKRQRDGNWKYYEMQKNIITKREDSYHLAMIMYHLREIQRVSKIATDDIVAKALERLRIQNIKKIQGGSVGWGIPMLYLATRGLDDKLTKRSLQILLDKSIHNKNFRVRALTAWALAKAEDYELS